MASDISTSSPACRSTDATTSRLLARASSLPGFGDAPRPWVARAIARNGATCRMTRDARPAGEEGQPYNRAQAFLDAATALGVEVVVGTDRKQALADEAPGTTLALDFDRVPTAADEVVRFAASNPFGAVVGADEETVVLAAAVSQALGLRHNPPEAVRITRNKHALRSKLREAGLRTPG